MSRNDLIERLNVIHLQRALRFNKAAPAEQVRLAKDSSFWRVPNCCSEFTWDGVCLECGRRSRPSFVSRPAGVLQNKNRVCVGNVPVD